MFFSVNYFQTSLSANQCYNISWFHPTIFQQFVSFFWVLVVTFCNIGTSNPKLASWSRISLLIFILVSVIHFGNIYQFELHMFETRPYTSTMFFETKCAELSSHSFCLAIGFHEWYWKGNLEKIHDFWVDWSTTRQ